MSETLLVDKCQLRFCGRYPNYVDIFLTKSCFCDLVCWCKTTKFFVWTARHVAWSDTDQQYSETVFYDSNNDKKKFGICEIFCSGTQIIYKGNNGVIQATPNFNHSWNAMLLSQISTFRCRFIVVARMYVIVCLPKMSASELNIQWRIILNWNLTQSYIIFNCVQQKYPLICNINILSSNFIFCLFFCVNLRTKMAVYTTLRWIEVPK